MAAFEELLAEDFVDHNALPGQPEGRSGLRIGRHRRGQPSAACAARLRTPLSRATTWPAESPGAVRIPAVPRRPGDGREVHFAAFHNVRFVDGFAAEWWGTGALLDAFRFRQIGATIRPAE